MATFTEHARDQLPGGDLIIRGTLTLGTLGASGQETITVTGVERIEDLWVQGAGYLFRWTKNTQKLEVRVPYGNTSPANAAGTPVASGTDLSSAVAAVPAVVFGR
jgi:hypothetical protein